MRRVTSVVVKGFPALQELHYDNHSFSARDHIHVLNHPGAPSESEAMSRVILEVFTEVTLPSKACWLCELAVKSVSLQRSGLISFAR